MGHTKSLYSISKMKNDKQLSDIYDLIALHGLTEDVRNCSACLAPCTRCGRPSAGR